MPTGVAHIHRQEFVQLAEALLDTPEPAALFDQYRNKEIAVRVDSQGHSLKETLIAAIADCLNHEDYSIAANAAIVLRKNTILSSRACELDTVVSELTDQLNRNSIQAAKEAALALGFFLSTRPKDRKLPQWGGSDPMASSTMVEDLDQGRFVVAPVGPGHLHEVNPEIAEAAIDGLIDNLNRPKSYRSANWDVAKECGKAIGAIGYQRPLLVEDAAPVLKDLLGEQDERQPWLVYALTSIGYSRPSLVSQDLATNLEEFVTEAGFEVGWKLRDAASVGYRKIGHAPVCLESAGCDPDTDLSMVVEKLYKFMLGRHPSLPNDVTQAFISIYQSRPEPLVDLLAEELEQILNGESRSFDFPDNFMLLLNKLAGVDPTGLEPLLDYSTQCYQDQSRSHYWYDNMLEFHRRVAAEDEDLLPDELGEVVTEFLESEMRHSVQSHGRSFLQEIGEWDEDILSSPPADEVVEVNIREIDGLEISETELPDGERSAEENEQD